MKSITEMVKSGYGSKGTLQAFCTRNRYKVVDGGPVVLKTAGGGKWLIDEQRYIKIQQSEY
jgi:hypothetical protein